MSKKIIQFSEYEGFEKYNKTLSGIHTLLDNSDENILDYCVQLAVLGKWKKWADKEPVGSQINFNVKILRETGDENIKILLQFADHIFNLRERLKFKPKHPLRKAQNKSDEDNTNESNTAKNRYGKNVLIDVGDKFRNWMHNKTDDKSEKNNSEALIEGTQEQQFCPVCGRKVPFFARYPRYICRHCHDRITDVDERPVDFYNQEGTLGHGCVGIYSDTKEPYHSNICFVDNVECYAEEARFGGIVIQTKLEIKFQK